MVRKLKETCKQYRLKMRKRECLVFGVDIIISDLPLEQEYIKEWQLQNIEKFCGRKLEAATKKLRAELKKKYCKNREFNLMRETYYKRNKELNLHNDGRNCDVLYIIQIRRNWRNKMIIKMMKKKNYIFDKLQIACGWLLESETRCDKSQMQAKKHER